MTQRPNAARPGLAPAAGRAAALALVQGPAAALLCAGLLSGCVRYRPQPITAAATLETFEARRLDSPDLATFVQTSQTAVPWPPPAWDLGALTLAAFFYSPELDIARARWGVASGGVVSAGARQNPSLSTGIGYNATTPIDEVTPWIPEAVLDLPLDIAGKRGIRVAEARQLSEAARLNVVTAAWQVRGRVRTSFLDLFVATSTDSILSAQQAIEAQVVAILESQEDVGEVSPLEVTRARIALSQTQLEALQIAQSIARARSELADAVGVPPRALDDVALGFRSLTEPGTNPPAAEVRRQALYNRSDILGALAEYEAAQAALQLEVRKQYPDISLGPGYQLDQSDVKLVFGLSLSLPILDRNRGPIAEAAARREEAAARFLAVQSKALAEIEASIAETASALAQVQTADSLATELARRAQTAQLAYTVGEISRLELLGVQAELAASARARIEAVAAAQRAIGRLEDAMQSPIDAERWVLGRPIRDAGRERDQR